MNVRPSINIEAGTLLPSFFLHQRQRSARVPGNTARETPNMKLNNAEDFEIGNAFAAVATTLATVTASPATSVPSTTSPVSSPVSTTGTPTSETIEPPTEPSYPPATGTPGPIDQQIDSVVSELRANVVGINARYSM